MSKLTIFILFLCAVTVTVAAELLVNDYLQSPYAVDSQATVLVDTPAPADSAPVDSAPADPVVPTQVTSGQITPELLTKAGFEESTTIEEGTFDGKVFEKIEVKELSAAEFHWSQVRTPLARAGNILQIQTENKEVAADVYSLLKAKSSAQIGIIMNETNTYGEGSFYNNFVDDTSHVFLVVKKGKNVYALTYLKELHDQFIQLLSLLADWGASPQFADLISLINFKIVWQRNFSRW